MEYLGLLPILALLGPIVRLILQWRPMPPYDDRDADEPGAQIIPFPHSHAS